LRNLRKRWLLLPAILLLVLLVRLEPTGVIWGTLRGEAFYKGRPTSYWRKEMASYHESHRINLVFAFAEKPSFFDRLRERLGLKSKASQLLPLPAPAILGSEPAAVPVLAELLDDPEQTIRAEAANALAATMPRSAAVIVVFQQALTSRHRDVRWVAGYYLYCRGPEHSQLAIPVYIEGLQDGEPVRRSTAALGLRALGPAARIAVPALLDAWRKEDSEGVTRSHMEEALRVIDPNAATQAGIR
jgi:hypothetical protein